MKSKKSKEITSVFNGLTAEEKEKMINSILLSAIAVGWWTRYLIDKNGEKKSAN